MMSSNDRPWDHIQLLSIGTVIEVSGGHIVVELDRNITELSRVYHGDVYEIGQFGSILKVHFGRKAIFAIVTRLRMKTDYEIDRVGKSEAELDQRVLDADLIGEGDYLPEANSSERFMFRFSRGVSTYPLPLQQVYLTPRDELETIYTGNSPAGLNIGSYVGVDNTNCHIDVNEFVGKHAAVLGSTGTGKSACVAAIVKGIFDVGKAVDSTAAASADESEVATLVETGWRPKIIILDPHNEYQSAFLGATILSPDDGSLILPYWLLSLQETIELLIGRTEHVATSQANLVKDALIAARRDSADRSGLGSQWITVDSPIPYDFEVFIQHVENAKPSAPSKQDPHNSVLDKLRILREDRRMSFMMSPGSEEGEEHGPDSVRALVAVMQRLLGGNAGPTIVDLSGVPSEVAGVVSGTVARLLFSWRLWQSNEERSSNPILLVCEEAHLYVPNRGSAQFADAQNAIRRIVREGRKYGLSLLIVSQRPSEIDESVLSQCNSWIVLRIGNENDQARVRSALPDSMAGLASTLSSLRRQEAIVLGQATTIPARIRVRTLADNELPRSHDIDYLKGWSRGPIDESISHGIARRWQTQGRLSEPQDGLESVTDGF